MLKLLSKVMLGGAALVLLCSAAEHNSWKQFPAMAGKCEIAFPQTPEHVRQTMSMPEDDYDMHYDVYVCPKGNEAVYMVLVAEYPEFVNEEYAEMSLESFLNGILTQHPNNQLIFADMVDFQGHKALDFFIKTKGVYFKGRAIMSKNHLYLLAMECEQNNYKESDFNFFIGSFALHD